MSTVQASSPATPNNSRELCEVISYAIAAHKKGDSVDEIFARTPTDNNGYLARYIMSAIDHFRPDVTNLPSTSDVTDEDGAEYWKNRALEAEAKMNHVAVTDGGLDLPGIAHDVLTLIIATTSDTETARIASDNIETFRSELRAKPLAPASKGVEESAIYKVALTALETLRGYAATVVEDHKKDSYTGDVGCRPQDVAPMWAGDIHGIDVKVFLDEAISDQGLSLATILDSPSDPM